MSLLVEVIAGTDSFVAFGTSLSGSNRAAGWPLADVTGKQGITYVSKSRDAAESTSNLSQDTKLTGTPARGRNKPYKMIWQFRSW